MSRDRKVQVGARVPADVKALAFQAASAAGVSFNQWLEDVIVAAAGRETVPTQIDGQLDIATAAEQEQVDRVAGAADEVFGLPIVVSDDVAPGTLEVRQDGETVATMDVPGEDTLVAHAQRVPDLKAFAKNCRNETLHWRCSPGNPCKFCGGEA